jgi:hypothetical protein
VLVIKGWHRKIVIDWMNLEPLERVHWGATPLPDVPHRIEQAIVVIFINRSRRGHLQADVRFCLLVIKSNMLQHCIELILSRKSEGFS